MSLPRPLERYNEENERQTRLQLDQRLTALAPQAGTYTPVVTSSGGGETVTYSTQLGYWVRVGSLVWFSANLVLATKSGGSGDIQVSLPAMPADGPSSAVAVSVDAMAAGWTGAPMARVSFSANAVLVRELASGAAAQAWSKLGSTGIIRLTGSYLAAL